MAKLKRLEATNIKGLKSLEVDFEQHGNVEVKNMVVRQNARYLSVKKARDEAKAVLDKATKAISNVEARKKHELAHAKMPVPGLAFDEDGVTLNGVRSEGLWVILTEPSGRNATKCRKEARNAS